MRVEHIGKATLYIGDCIESMRSMPDCSVNTCITSPPYFGLRDYGHADQMGLEATPDEYIAKMVEVFREVRRVLRDDGTLWLNIGDSYAGSWGAQSRGTTTGEATSRIQGSSMLSARQISAHPHGLTGTGSVKKTPGIKPKDLIGIPWMLAFALRADGWYLRQDIIWHKPNPMPESVTDRCTKAHEYIFLLSKSSSYYCDMGAIKERATGQAPGNVNAPKGQAEYEAGDDRHRTKAGLAAYAARARSKRDSFKREGSKRDEVIPGQSVGTHREDRTESEWPIDTRNKRSVWTVSTKPFSGAHFAVFPTELIEPCVIAGCPVGGTVLDPFGGSGTTGIVSVENSRKAILCELNPDYAAMAADRINDAQRQQRLIA